jgi:glycosyltransferase involved in cell wall biosynthesis
VLATSLLTPSARVPSRVIYLITGLAFGGAETQLVHLALRMRARGWDVQVITMIAPRAYVEELQSAGIPVNGLRMSRGVPDPRALFRLARMLRQSPPHILHANMVHANLLARLVRPFAPVPVLVCTAQNTYESPTGVTIIKEITWREWAYRLTDPLCDVTTQVSQAGLERYVRVKAVPRDKICFIPNGVDVDHFRPDAQVRLRMRAELGLQDRFAWLAVGRFEQAKDYPNLLHAFARLSDENAVLLIAGQGALRERMEALAHELKIAPRVYFLGLRRDIPELMNAADAYVMSSFYEGMPMVLLEAAASGLPIVATAVGGNGEVVLDSRTGFLVSAKDPSVLADAMLRLMRLPEPVRLAMGQAGRAHVEANYSFERIIAQWERLYFKLVNKA